MTDDERDYFDYKFSQLEQLVKQQLCKCTFSPPYTYPAWRAYNGCPVHTEGQGVRWQ